jgi:hypothetical protein
VSTPLSRTRAVAATLVGVVALSGCGGDKKSKEACLTESYNAAEAAAVAKAYDAGRLGTRKKVESELNAPPGGGASFFDESGHLIPYRKLDLAHKIQLVAWMSTGRVGELTFDVRHRARANAHPDC